MGQDSVLRMSLPGLHEQCMYPYRQAGYDLQEVEVLQWKLRYVREASQGSGHGPNETVRGGAAGYCRNQGFHCPFRSRYREDGEAGAGQREAASEEARGRSGSAARC